MNLIRRSLLLLAASALVAFGDASLPAQDAADSKPAERELRLADYLSNAKLVGKFTIDGREGTQVTEEYTIGKCEKLPEKDMYRLTARLKYGNIDSEVPLDIKILWAGDTPVITLDSFWIPGMGSFGARILIHADQYAGTWLHVGVGGGHMYGKIVKDSDDSEESAE